MLNPEEAFLVNLKDGELNLAKVLPSKLGKSLLNRVLFITLVTFYVCFKFSFDKSSS